MYSFCRIKNDAFAGFAGCSTSMDMVVVFFSNNGCSGPTLGEYYAIHAISESAPVQSYLCTLHRNHVFPRVALDGKSIIGSAWAFRLVTNFRPNLSSAKRCCGPVEGTRFTICHDLIVHCHGGTPCAHEAGIVFDLACGFSYLHQSRPQHPL